MTMPEYRRYRRTQIAEMADWEPGFNMSWVSVSLVDAVGGSPKEGDKIPRNPANHEDRWLVAADYFTANFAPETAAPDDAVSVLEGMETQGIITEWWRDPALRAGTWGASFPFVDENDNEDGVNAGTAAELLLAIAAHIEAPEE